MVTIKGKEISLAGSVSETGWPDFKYTAGMTGVLLGIDGTGRGLLALKLTSGSSPSIIFATFMSKWFTFTGKDIELTLDEYSPYLEGKDTVELTAQTTRAIKLE